MPETKDLNRFRLVVYSIENLEWWQRQLANIGKLSIEAALEWRLRKTQGRIKQIFANSLRRRGIVVRDVRNDLSEVGYGRAGDFDSEIHWGMRARTSSMDLASAG